MANTLAPITNALEAYAAAGEYFAKLDASGSWQAAAIAAVTYEYPTPHGIAECRVTRGDVAIARAMGAI